MEPLQRTEPAEPSIVSALGRVLEAGQRIVVDRIDLARIDLLTLLSRTGQGAVFVIAGIIPMSVGWVALSAAAIMTLENYMTRPASIALVGGINVLCGVLLVVLGVQRAREDGDTPPSATR